VDFFFALVPAVRSLITSAMDVSEGIRDEM
jgi:hypothetical protein